ncbi:SCP2 sterol-binding domain-containing protein [Bailinhaonella thermotolerans]|uniref:SCP2 domain-containing protein n=1 Tax=Bailinhaonella thermotolerans TaxID=1070861 RepID=A0A3A4A135_9ACTN|nr:SCP2 sterol-binding domain-containing protein [Bailinhaonella thermotolerans]RJL20680.1 hypothetical protein D5H75_39120 [Bailinhaonella thermotolerans]
MEQCRDALRDLVGRLSEIDAETRRRHIVERTVSCYVRDLNVTFKAKLRADGVDGVDEYDGQVTDADVRFTMTSDDLVDLVAERLDFAPALLTGRVKMEASFSDILRLRRML